MGLPFDPTYEPGDECSVCALALFGDKTPQFVYADVSGVSFCGLAAGWPDPNGVRQLTQNPSSPCQWQVFEDGTFPLRMGWTWNLFAGSSLFAIGGVPAGNFFFDQIMSVCQDSFGNANVCGAPFFPRAEGGTCIITW